MSNATRGTVLAGRYRLEDRYHANTDSSVWRAADLTLDRPVTVRVMRPGHPYAADVADAARRAALIDDPRLVRVLDVGSDGDVTFMVSSHVDGDSLATLIERAPLAPPVVRRIVGEVAQGLRGAAARGLHHLRLTPRSVIVCYDNTIKISGVAVEAAAAGLDPTSAAQATRVDALGLIGLLYAGLTGRWPLGDTGFPPAPRANGGGPIAPTELVPDIPGDLNRLCLLTLGPMDSGPHSPAEVVGMLSPWPTPEEAPLRSATRPRDPATPATPNPALVMRGRTPASGFRPGGPVTSGPTGAPASPISKRPAAPAPASPAASTEEDPDRTVASWPPPSGELFDPRRRDRQEGNPDPDATLPPSAGSMFASLRRDEAPPARAEAAPARAEAARPIERPDQQLNRRPATWPSGATTQRAAQPPAASEDVTRPGQARPGAPAQQPTAQPRSRRTASMFPTPSVAITGSMPLPPRVKTSERTDALFGEEQQQKALPAAGPQNPSAPQRQPQQPQQSQQRPPARPLEAAPSPQRAEGQQYPPMAAPLRPQRPLSNPAAAARPAQQPASSQPEPRSQSNRQARRTASLFPTPSVAMTGSMPLPPRGQARGRTEALFGDIDPAVDTQITPAPLQAVERAQQAAQQRAAQQQAARTGQPSAQPRRPSPIAQFAQPPRTDQSANPLDSGPIVTAAAARTAAGMRAGRPTSRPIEGPEAGQPEPNPVARPIVPGAAPSLFASPHLSAANPTAGHPAATGPGAGGPGFGDAPASGLASPHEAGQHAGMGSERAAGPGRHRGPAEGRAPAAANSRLPWEDGWSSNPGAATPPSPLESSGPFPIVIPPDAPPKDQSRKVLIGILVVFVVLLVLAAWSLRGLFGGTVDAAGGPREQGPVLTTAPVASSTGPDPETSAAVVEPSATEEPEPIEIVTASALDPQGDGDEDSAAAPRAVDGDEDTTWRSDRYQSASFGGLKKGLGLAIELQAAAAVSSAQIDVAGTGGSVQLRAADEPEYEGSTSLGSGSFEDGTVTVDAKDDVDPAKYVIVWFTELPAVESGYRMEVSEVRLT
ncbi:hypothetical protein [Kineosporia babensis]|uniref:Protein kinase domain-containing protein n=1 Tax=Kineosporia babensis TaxID=499548 RepID=A0A9X1SRS7_9ACTN|nr:hypothetical protein [Kineosporia babensis]MCD5309942.1 hypothetical protein [Kineosporia babensis]